jgi:Leucine-rich repeat (LRR) protein
MHPQAIDLAGCRVSDLSPLAGMSSLRRLRLDHNPVRDLSPLRGLKLTHLDLRGTDVKDLSPLKGMPLQRLVLDQTPAEDLRPLLGMPLQHLDIDGTPAGDLTPLTGMPLTYLKLNIAAPYRDFRLLGDIKTLKTIGDVPMHDWFADYDAFRNGAEDQGDEEAEDDCEAPPKPKKPKRSEPDKPANGGLDDLPSLGDEMGPLGL